MKYKDVYEELYASGYHSNYNLCHTTKMFPIVGKHLERGKTILDIGCSHGTAVLELQRAGHLASGIDISQKAIDLCNKRGIPGCVQSSVVDLPYEDNSLDAVITSDVLEHLDEKEVIPAIESMSRVLKKNGLAFCTISTVPEQNRSFDSIAKKHGLQNLHTFVATYESWYDLLITYFDIKQLVSRTQTSFFAVLEKK
jgi:ubiquinone/menaquinone biosynthesis C-methylase UbiE